MTAAAVVPSGEAHAKAILIGEHSVVYGQPAIALPIAPLRTIAEVRRVAGPLRVRNDGETVPLAELPERFASIGVAATAALGFFGLPREGLEIGLRSDIPAGAGLGASAAVAHAIVEAVRVHAGAPLDEESRFELVQTAERVAHGNPSGLDARATRADVPVFFETGSIELLPLAGPMWFAVADTGVRASTMEAVTGVARLVEARPRRGAQLIERLGELTREAAQDVAGGRVAELGARLLAAQEALGELGVGHEALDRLVAAALEAGAPGAKLTGAGRGGCVIALAGSAGEAEEVLRAMRASGAVAGWVVGIGAP